MRYDDASISSSAPTQHHFNLYLFPRKPASGLDRVGLLVGGWVKKATCEYYGNICEGDNRAMIQHVNNNYGKKAIFVKVAIGQ